MKIPLYASLRTRLLLVLFALTLLPIFLIGGLAYYNARQTVIDRLTAQLTSVADLKVEQISTWLDTTGSDARLLADNFLNQEHFTEILDPRTDPERRAAFAGFLTDNLVSVQRARAGYSEILIVDIEGQIILSTDSTRVGSVLTNYPVIAETLTSPTGQFIYDIHTEPYSGQPEMIFAHVLRAVDLDTFEELPTANGVVMIRVRVDKTIYPIIRAWPGMGNTGETLLIRADGDATLFINPLRFDDNAALNLRIRTDSPNAKPAHRAVAGLEGVIMTPDYRGVPVLAAYRHIPQMGWGFVAKEDVAEVLAPVVTLTQQWVLAAVLLLLAAAIVAVWLARAFTQPLARLVDATQRVAAGNLDTALNIQRRDEIGALANSFRAMVTAVRASHAELQAHSQEVNALFNISQTLLTTMDVTATLEHAIREAMTGTNSDAGVVLLASPDQNNIILQAVVGLPENIISQSFPIDINTAPGSAIIHREPVMTSDLTQEPEFRVPPFVREMGVRAVLAVPMLVDDKVLGALVLDSFEPRDFSFDEIHVTQAIANQTAVALERVRLFNDLSDSYDHTLDALVTALDARDKETQGHSQRVVAYTLALARRLGLPEDELTTIRRGALLHDIGKIGVPDAILHKPGPLTEEEWAIIRRHPEWGERILAGIGFLSGATQIVYAHHERWNGSGYPNALAGAAIPLGARIFAVADTFDAITSDRPYRKAQPYAQARSEIEAGSGSEFDSQVVTAFLEIPEEEWTRLQVEALVMSGATDLLTLWATRPNTVALRPELAVLNKLIVAVNDSLDLDEVLQEAVHATVDVLGAAACAILLYDSEADTLALAADHNLPAALKTRLAHLPVAGFHNEIVVREACERLLDDITEVPLFVEMGLPDTQPDWGAYLCVPLTAGDEITGVMGVLAHRARPFSEYDRALYTAMGEQAGMVIANARQRQAAQLRAMTDALTGAYNRRYFDNFLEQEFQRCARYKSGFSLIMLDIDHFTVYNYAYGYPAGDEVLRQLVSLTRQNIRAVDVIARYGGDKFIVVLPETDRVGALDVAEKLRALVEARSFTRRHLTVSVGVAYCFDDGTEHLKVAETLIYHANQALYNAKRSGHNQVCVWKPDLIALPKHIQV